MRKFFLWSLAVLLSAFSCSQSKQVVPKKKSNEYVFRKDARVYVLKNKDTVAVFDTEIADDEYERETGLMYRKSMKENQAMLFVFDDEDVRFFYMKNTYIPLDIVYIGADSVIVSIAKQARPLDETPLSSHYPARFVLEIKGGLADQKGIARGDRIVIEKSN